MRTLLATFVALYCSLAATAHAERPAEVDTSRESAAQLAHSFSRGASHSYVLRGSFESEGLEGINDDTSSVTVTMPITYEVQSVDPASRALVATSLQAPEVTITRNGEPESGGSLADALRSARLTQTVAPDGSVVDRTGALEANNATNANTMGFISDVLAVRWVQFPQEPVVTGDSWLQVVPMDMHDTENNLTATISVRYTLTGFAQTAGGEVAVIDAVYSTSIDGQMVASSGRSVRVVGRGHGEGYILFNHARGQLQELSLHNGVVLTTTENNGARSTTAFSSDVELRAQVIAAETP